MTRWGQGGQCCPLPPSFSAPQSSPPQAGRLGCRESRGTKATTLALPLNINRGWPVKKDYGYRPEQGEQLQAESNTLFYWIPAYGENDGGREQDELR